MRIGIGYDIHRLRRGRKLVLGGVAIPYKSGLVGHSDADVLLHSICDAILGACGLGDIGEHFPDTDPRYKDISSTFLLSRVQEMVKRKKMKVINVDSILVLEEPKVTKYKSEMKKKISKILGTNSINIKAKTNEKLGPIGKKQAIAAISVVTLK